MAAATAILDSGGEEALTFRALASRLSTGPGALYHHVTDKADLLAACTGQALEGVVPEHRHGGPIEDVRAIAAGVYDVLEDHPWIGTELAQRPGHPGMLPVVEGLGSRLGELGLSGGAQFDATTALLNFVLGLAGQKAAAARLAPPDSDRIGFLTSVAERWAALDPAHFPYLHQTADRLPGHDDRAQFLAGVDLILRGIDTLVNSSGKRPTA